MTHKHSGATLLTNQMLARSAYITITTTSFATCYDDFRSRHPMVAGLSNFAFRSLMATATDINDAVLHLRDRLSDHFEFIRSVSFAQVGTR